MNNIEMLDALQKLQEFNEHCNELVDETNQRELDLLELIKKARKCDFNETSYARKSFLEMMEMNVKYGLNIKYVADYDISLDELKNKSITDLILENPNERDEYWIVDFTKDFVKNIRKEIEDDASFKYVEGKLVRVKDDTPKTIRKYAKRILNFRTEADKEFLKLLDSIIEVAFDKESCGNPIVVESALKLDLLEENYETLESNFENTIEDLIEYNIYHVSSKQYAKQILTATKKLLDAGYTPKDIELKVEDNWLLKISEFLNEEISVEDNEFGFNSISNQLDEDDWNTISNLNNEREEERKKEAKENKAANAKKCITIQRICDGEILFFETKGECMKYLNVSSDTFSRFLKGKSKLNNKYYVIV